MNTQVSYFKKVLVVLMAVMMVFTMMPSMTWAAEDNISSESSMITSMNISAPDGTAVFYEEGKNGEFYLRQASTADTIWREDMPIGFSEQVYKYFVLCNNSTTGEIPIRFKVTEGVNVKYQVGSKDMQEASIAADGTGQFTITASAKTSGNDADLLANKSCKVVLTVSKDDTSQAYEINFFRKNNIFDILNLKIDDTAPLGYDSTSTTELTVGVDGTFSLHLETRVGFGWTGTLSKEENTLEICSSKTFTIKDKKWDISELSAGKYYIRYSNKKYTHTLILNAIDQAPRKINFFVKNKETSEKISDAQITVFDKDEKLLTSGEDGYSLSPGGYTYVIKKQGYFTEQGNFLVEAEAKTVTVELTPCDTVGSSNTIERFYGEHYSAGTLSGGGEWTATQYENTDIYIANIEKVTTFGVDYTIRGTLVSPTAMVRIIDVNGNVHPVSYTIVDGKRTFNTDIAFFAFGAQHFTVHVSDDGLESKEYELILVVRKYSALVSLENVMLRAAQDNTLLETSNQPEAVNTDSGYVKKAVVDTNRIVLQLKRSGSEPNFSLIWSLGTWFSNDENWVRINGGAWTRASASAGILNSSIALNLKHGLNIIDIKCEEPENPYKTQDHDGYTNVGVPVENAREVETEYTTLLVYNNAESALPDAEAASTLAIQAVEAKQWIAKRVIDINEFPVAKDVENYDVFIPESMVYPYIVLTIYPENPADDIKVDGALGERIGYNFVVPIKDKDSVNVTLSAVGGKSKNYTIDLIQKSNAAFIETLDVKNGKLNKEFVKEQFNYTIEASDWSAGDICLTPKFSEGATVKVNGIDFSGESISIGKKDQKTIIEVIAADTVTTKKYIFLQGNTAISESTKERATAILEKGWLKDPAITKGKYYGNYWGVFQAAATGIDLHNSTFEVKKLEDCKQATDYGATILQLVLMGENPYDYKGVNYVEALDNDDSHAYANDIFRLLAFTAVGYDYDEVLVENITRMAKSKSADLDLKSWALIAVSSLYDKAELAGIAETFKSKLQVTGKDAGMFVGDYGANANTQGCVISALVSAGIDVGSEEWTSNGIDPLSVMEKSYVREDGKIYYINPENMPSYWTSVECDYNKDFIIALGDIIAGSSVWQREALTREKFDDLLAQAEKMASGKEGTTAQRAYVEKKCNRAKAEAAGKDVNAIKGLGYAYYDLYEAMSRIDSSMKMSDPNAVKVKSLSVNGNVKSDYTLNENFDSQGISFTVMYEDGTSEDLTLDQVNLIGFDTATSGMKPIRFEYRGVYSDVIYITVTGNSSAENTNTVLVTVKDPAGKTYYDTASIAIEDGETAYSVLSKTGLKISCRDSQYGLYVEGIEGLYEFDKGKGSGWMYRVNGVFPNYSAALYKLKKGDKVEWLYTRNYGADIGAGNMFTPGGAGGEEVKDVTTDTKTGITTAPTDVKVSEKTNADGTKTKVAEVKVSADNQKEILKQAKASKSKEIILNVSSKSVGDATKADVTLDKSFINSIVKDTNAKLTIRTPFGDKTYTQEELKAMSEAATGATVTVAIEKAAEEEPQIDANALTAKLTPVARSAKTAKKNVKVIVSLDKQDKAMIQELKDAGYTVKYRFYRSTKKAAGYKAAVTKKTASYINTGGKKGTKYFYKVQVRAYDENGKLTAKTALKQCKYASRTWAK